MEKNENESKARKIKLSSIIIVIACVVVVAGVFVYTSKVSKNKKGGFPGFPGGPGGKQNTVVSVKTQKAQKSVLHDYVNTNGEIEPQSSISVYPDNGGTVVKVLVSLGSAVKKGEVIARIDPSVPGVQYALSPVTAPVAGTITKTPLKVGSKVSTSSEITVIGDVQNLQISASIPERYVSSLRTGLKANVILEAYPDVIFNATVIKVSPVVDSSSRTKEVILNFDKYDSRINAGMFAKVKLYTQDYKGSVVVPESCIITNNGKNYVFTVNEDGQSVSRKFVDLGKTVDNMTQLLNGVNEGESVVTEGMRILADGSKIRDITNGVINESSDKELKDIPGKSEGDRK